MQETVVEPVYQKMVFWVSVAFILNFSGNFFLFLYSKNSFNSVEFQRQYTIIYSSVTILKNILLCIAVSIKEKKKELQSDSFYIDSSLDDSFLFKNEK
jgi:Na+-transporting NADH:ubiquinone oxidoreductase subunit NqrD